MLLLVMLVTSLLGALALSAASQTEQTIAVTRNASTSLQSEFAAESAMEYAQRQLLRDMDWAGTGLSPVVFGDGSVMSIEVFETNPGLDDNLLQLKLTGEVGDGKMQLGADLFLEPGIDPFGEFALMCLGGVSELDGSFILGDVLITDLNYVVDDWVDLGGGTGHYAGAGPIGLIEYRFPVSTLFGRLFKYSNNSYHIGTEEVQVSAHVRMPIVNLDEYLIPGSDRIIYTNVVKLQNVIHQETAVFILEEGTQLTLENCRFPGGVVVYVEPGYDLRSESRNKIELKEGTLIGGGTGGISNYIGLLAPACEISDATSLTPDEDDIYGYTMLAAIDDMSGFQSRGQLIVINWIEDLDDSWLIYDRLVAENVPSGITFDLPVTSTKLMGIWERFEL